jgi:hypothetical protein
LKESYCNKTLVKEVEYGANIVYYSRNLGRREEGK